MDIRAPEQRYNPYRIFSREQWAALRDDGYAIFDYEMMWGAALRENVVIA